MPLLIDTYNVLHTVGVLPPDLAGIDVQGLIELLAESRYRHEKTTLVCDGVPLPKPAKAAAGQAKPSATINIRYSGHGRPADDLIGQLIRASSAPRRLVVVSTDHTVQRSAKRRRCPTLTSQEFLQHLVNDVRGLESADKPAVAKPMPGEMTEDQIDRWIKVFNLDQETIAIPTGHVPPMPKKHATPPSEAVKSSGEPLDHQEVPVDEIAPLAGGALPPDLIAQAEMLWAQENRVAPPAVPKANPADKGTAPG